LVFPLAFRVAKQGTFVLWFVLSHFYVSLKEQDLKEQDSELERYPGFAITFKGQASIKRWASEKAAQESVSKALKDIALFILLFQVTSPKALF
jgi:hypothetical protein